MQEDRETLTLVDACPSFRHNVGSPNWISAAVAGRKGEEVDGDEFVSSDGFEFAVEFPDGHIRPFYPIFNRAVFLAEYDEQAHQIEEEGDDEKVARASLRRLLIEEQEACSRSGSTSSSSSVEDLVGVAPDTYCIWAPGSVPPSPIRTKKSSSTGSSLMRLRLRDLLIGRSHSDGKDKYKLFLAPAEEKQRSRHSGTAEHKEPPPPPAASAVAGVKKGKGRTRKVTELDVVTAHRLLYGKPGSGASNGRRTFLPYRVGFFAASGNGIGHL